MIEEQTENQASISFEKTKMAPGDSLIEKTAIDIRGKSLNECRKHFEEIWNKKK